MSALPQKKLFMPEEYLALEEEAEFWSEYEDGEIVAMAGGSISHTRIISNISRVFGNKMPSDCKALPAEMKVWAETYRKFYYPDVTVICGEPDFYPKRDDSITNPFLIFEVISKRTKAKDRGEKFEAYQSLPSLREYVLVSQNKPKVEKIVK